MILTAPQIKQKLYILNNLFSELSAARPCEGKEVRENLIKEIKGKNRGPARY